MSLIFYPSQVLERNKGLTFNDVLLMPRYSEIDSRLTPSLKSRVTKNYHLDTPIISANMDTVTEYQMANKMHELGGLGILHRFMSVEEQINQLKQIKGLKAASIGVKDEGMRRADFLADFGVDILTIDIAHGNSVMMLEVLDYVKNKYPKIDVIAGNVATFDGVRRLIEHGADAIKVGIGPGSMCTTRIVTGCGVPQLTALAICVQEAQRYDIPVIADGGIKNSGDMVKAFACGAETVMVGSLLSGCDETPGEILNGKKRYRGMASIEAQVVWKGSIAENISAEGESCFVNSKGSVEKIVSQLCGGIRSGMTYLNAKSIQEIYSNATFMEMTNLGLIESQPHGL
jgi:IMP dehydrogenase